MREWWREWGAFVRFLLIIAICGGAFVGLMTYSVMTAPDCHTVYVQTTPVDGKPAMERQEICQPR